VRDGSATHGKTLSFVRPNPVRRHRLIDFALGQTKQASDQDPVFAEQDRPSALHSAQVAGSTPTTAAAFLIDQPMLRCLARSCPAMLVDSRNGSQPVKRTMEGMSSIDGSVLPFSQFRTVAALTPSRSATCPWVSFSRRRRFRACCPRVRASKSVSFGFGALSRSGTSRKRATQPCRFTVVKISELARVAAF
jgi:hypothetical protein